MYMVYVAGNKLFEPLNICKNNWNLILLVQACSVSHPPPITCITKIVISGIYLCTFIWTINHNVIATMYSADSL